MTAGTKYPAMAAIMNPRAEALPLVLLPTPHLTVATEFQQSTANCAPPN